MNPGKTGFASSFSPAANATPGCRKPRRFSELMEQYKTPDSGRRLATVLLGADDMGRPMFAPPNMAADRLKTLR